MKEFRYQWRLIWQSRSRNARAGWHRYHGRKRYLVVAAQIMWMTAEWMQLVQSNTHDLGDRLWRKAYEEEA